MKKALVRRTLTEFFRDLVQSALRTHNISSSEQSEFYLVNLLERFAHPATDWDARPLALDYLESFQASPPERIAKLKRVGDTALFLSGMFMDHLEGQVVSTEYYMRLGRLGYAQLGAMLAAQSDLFAELARRFPDFVRVLSEISFEEVFRSNAQAVRIYTRWLRTRGARDAEWLMRHGITPCDPGSKIPH